MLGEMLGEMLDRLTEALYQTLPLVLACAVYSQLVKAHRGASN